MLANDYVMKTLRGLPSFVALALGFRPTAGPVAWLAAVGVLTLFAFALVWLSAALGLAAKTVETASNTPMVLTLLPFLGSGFVPTATMPPRKPVTFQTRALPPKSSSLPNRVQVRPLAEDQTAVSAYSCVNATKPPRHATT